MRAIRLCVALTMFAGAAHAQDNRHIVLGQAQYCQAGPAWSPTLPNDGEYTYYLPPDVPDPVAIVEASIAAENGWPAGVTAPGGVWFAGVDHGQTYLSCSHWPFAQDCPTIGQSQWERLDGLTILGVGDPRLNDFRSHTPPIMYHRGDVILYQMSCNTPGGGEVINGTVNIGLVRPKYTPHTACDTATKLTLHGGLFPDPATGNPLTTFISDSSPSWRNLASKGTGAPGDVTIDTTTPTPVSSPAPSNEYSALPGNSSIHFDGAANSIIWANSSGDFKMAAGDWTVEFWWRPGNVGAAPQVLVAFTTYGPFAIAQVGTSIMFSSSSNGTSWNVAPTVAFGTASLGVWTHLVAQRQGNSILLSQDGVLKLTVPVSGSLFDPPQAQLSLGNVYGQWNVPATGNMQEFRISKVARYPGGAFALPGTLACP